MNVVVERQRLLAEIRSLQEMVREYELFLQKVNLGEPWVEAGMELAIDHKDRLYQSNVTVKTMELVNVLIQKMLANIRVNEIRLKKAPTLPDFTPQRPSVELANLEALINQLNSVASHAPLALQEKIRFLLLSLSTLFRNMLRKDSAQVDESISQINLLTSNKESQQLVREIAMIAREIYNTLTSFTEGIAIDTLNETADGISEAVRRLKGVINKLEEATLNNLEMLEGIINSASKEEAALSDILQGLRKAQNKLGVLKLERPDLAEIISGLQDKLGDGVGSAMMLMQSRAHENQENYMTMMANQSFQDLTGQTLKKIIGFVENIELQMIRLLQKYKPVLGLSESHGSTPRPARDSQMDESRQSQDQVDALLSELGF